MVPQISVILGPCAGGAVYSPAMTDFSFMVREKSHMFITGPDVVKTVTGEEVTLEELGGASSHSTKSGVATFVGEDEKQVLDEVKTLSSYLPSNNLSEVPSFDTSDDRDRLCPELNKLLPESSNQPYEMREIINSIVDNNSFFEMTKFFGRGIITGFARIDGYAVGVLANDSNFYAGSMSAQGARKTTRFVKLCNTFHLPIVSLVDEPGFLIGSDAELEATILHGAEAVLAVAETEVPWATIMIRKSFGVAAAAHYGPNGYVLAWPSAESGPLPLEGGVAVAFKKEIEASDNPEVKRKEIEKKMSKQQNPFPRAESFSVHEIIDPRETSAYLREWVERIQPQLKAKVLTAK